MQLSKQYKIEKEENIVNGAIRVDGEDGAYGAIMPLRFEE